MHLRPLFLAALLALPLPSARAQAVSAAAYVVIDNGTGHIFGSSNAGKKMQVGSLTKLATAMVVLDWSEAQHQELSQLATVPPSAEAIPTLEGAIPFRAGDRCTLRELLYAALLQSDNRAAQTLADHVGRSLGGDADAVTAFVIQMNALGRKVGMKTTRFLNPHGLEDTERALPYSTAEDMGQLARYAMERAAFRFYVSQRERKIMIQTTGGPQNYLCRNTNELLGVDGIDGVKTGTTRRAGQCLIVSAGRAPESRQEGEKHFITPRRISVVVLGSSDRFGVARGLLARGWQEYDQWAAQGRPSDRKEKR